MTNGHGGRRTPSSPAPVSGPGALSKRTDGGPGGKQPVRDVVGLPYGDGQVLQQIQAAAPMAASPGGNAPTLNAGSAPSRQMMAFGAPTAQPDVPVTAGADSGPGPGTEALGLPNQQDEDMQALVAYLPVFEAMANVPGSSSSARNLVRAIKGAM